MKMYVFDLGGMYLDEAQLVTGINAAAPRNQNPPARRVHAPSSVKSTPDLRGFLPSREAKELPHSRTAQGDGNAAPPSSGTEENLTGTRLLASGRDTLTQ